VYRRPFLRGAHHRADLGRQARQLLRAGRAQPLCRRWPRHGAGGHGRTGTRRARRRGRPGRARPADRRHPRRCRRAGRADHGGHWACTGPSRQPARRVCNQNCGQNCGQSSRTQGRAGCGSGPSLPATARPGAI
jgi:hypothetical protein